VRDAIDFVSSYDTEHQLVFIKAWNEWAEGNYLEPDAYSGLAFLQAIRAELTLPRSSGEPHHSEALEGLLT
jgi:hypothetical protein